MAESCESQLVDFFETQNHGLHANKNREINV